ncbi:DNA/RNA non-specific endonuclease [bacterium]|nr:DNA/RNA non-specific endonuclease [bacterium]
MKNLFAISLIFLAATAHAWTQRQPNPPQACGVHAPYGLPATIATQSICRQAYLVGYDAAAKIPRYVTYTLIPKNALGCVVRTNAFATDQSVKNGATPDDYAGTGYDKGHMSPDGDLSWDPQVEYESFLMTNMAPQAGSLNRGIWKLLETSVRGWAVQHNNSFTIYVGTIYNAQDKRIGSGVVVPHAFYKIVINNQTNETAGWSFPHVAPYPNLGNDLTRFRLPVSQIQTMAGVQYAFPPNAKELNPGSEWTVDFGALTRAKRAKCGQDD